MEKDYFSVTDLMHTLEASFGEGNVKIEHNHPNAGLPTTTYKVPGLEKRFGITALHHTIGYVEKEYPVYRAHVDLKIPANTLNSEQIKKYETEGINVKSNGKCTRLRITVDTEKKKTDSPNTIEEDDLKKAIDTLSHINRTY